MGMKSAKVGARLYCLMRRKPLLRTCRMASTIPRGPASAITVASGSMRPSSHPVREMLTTGHCGHLCRASPTSSSAVSLEREYETRITSKFPPLMVVKASFSLLSKITWKPWLSSTSTRKRSQFVVLD
jgi:hypothetical protein